MLDSPLKIKNTIIANRVALQPMEGCDCNTDGSPSELTVSKYMSAARSGAGLIWFEANAVCPEGRTNPHQMMLTRDNINDFKRLVSDVRRVAREVSGINPVLILQLTHSGRQSITPMIAYRHQIYEEQRPVSDENIVSDEYLDSLPEKYAESAKLAIEVGFDGVDVKSCHGYLFQELLSAFTRDGRYGGSFENRTKLYLNSFIKVREAIPKDALLTSRLSVSDMVKKPYGFGTTEENRLDLTEPKKLIGLLVREGLDILNVTVGNPYYNPHVNRPYRKGGYEPPETREAGLERFSVIEKFIKKSFPALTVLGSGLSYYKEKIFRESERQLAEGICDIVGYGRMWIAYPDFYSDFKSGIFDTGKCCLTCSKCTELMRAKQVSGCAVFNAYYRNLYKEIIK